MSSLILTKEEIIDLTGYKSPNAQLDVLRKMGFFRARQNQVTRQITLERLHFEAVCSGQMHSSKIKKEFVINRPA